MPKHTTPTGFTPSQLYWEVGQDGTSLPINETPIEVPENLPKLDNPDDSPVKYIWTDPQITSDKETKSWGARGFVHVQRTTTTTTPIPIANPKIKETADEVDDLKAKLKAMEEYVTRMSRLLTGESDSDIDDVMARIEELLDIEEDAQ